MANIGYLDTVALYVEGKQTVSGWQELYTKFKSSICRTTLFASSHPVILNRATRWNKSNLSVYIHLF